MKTYTYLTFFAGLFAATASAAAHTVPTPVPTPAATDEALVLSPFEVNTSSDVGYVATSSLAGSRLNASLKDTPAIIDVFTKEFLLDIGATNLEQAMAYANNSQTDDGDTLRVNNGITQTAAGNSFNFRSRGILGNSTRNYFETRLGGDFYNTERLDDSRGPNSVLFGIGSAGGIINNSPKRAQFGSRFAETSLQTGTQDQGRATLDLNLPLVPRKLAARLNALYDHKGSWRDYIASTRRAGTVALTYRPFAQTEIRVDAERGKVRGTLGRNYPVVDGITGWWGTGSTTVASTVTTAPTAAQVALGYTRPLTATRLVYVENQDFVLNALNAWSTAPAGAFAPTILNDPGRVPYRANAAGPGGRTLHDYDQITIIGEHRFTPTFVGEVGYYHEFGSWTNYDVGGDNVTLRGDPNALLRNPANFHSFSGFRPATDASGNLVNPNAGGTYLETPWLRRVGRTASDNLRATLAYEKNAGRWGTTAWPAWPSIRSRKPSTSPSARSGSARRSTRSRPMTTTPSGGAPTSPWAIPLRSGSPIRSTPPPSPSPSPAAPPPSPTAGSSRAAPRAAAPSTARCSRSRAPGGSAVS